MKSIFTAVLLSIACLAFVGCGGDGWEEYKAETQKHIEEATYSVTISESGEIMDEEYWRKDAEERNYRYVHTHWRFSITGKTWIHVNSCKYWDESWTPLSDEHADHYLEIYEDVRETSHPWGLQEHGIPLILHCLDEEVRTPKQVAQATYTVYPNANHRNRWKKPYWRENRDGEIWLHGNSCKQWNFYWQAIPHEQFGHWLDKAIETDEELRNHDGRIIRIHCTANQYRR